MVKVRMNTADVSAEVTCLRRLIGMRCANVYDVTPKTYLFKLMNSSGITESGESEKVLLLMESGIRLHTTAYARDKNMTPSGFTLKLRKHIRTRRLEDVRQLGYDRIILFQFGLGENAHYIILELFAQGNILLLDANFIVMTLLRSHRDDDKGLAIMSRHKYPMESCRLFERTCFEKIKVAFTSHLHDNIGTINVEAKANDEPIIDKGHDGKKFTVPRKKSSDSGKFKKFTLKAILGEALAYGPALSEHIILDAGLLPNSKIGDTTDGKIDDSLLQSLAKAVDRFECWLSGVMAAQETPEGYILMQVKATMNKISDHEVPSGKIQIYDEFCPLLLNQFRSRECLKFETFDAALDEFYSKIESQRSEQQKKAKEDTAMQKLDKIRSDQENRVQILKREGNRCQLMAELIEYNLEDVDSAILAVRVALANGMSWDDLTRMVKEEKKSGNPVAGLIDKLHLERNCIVLLLSNNLDEMDDEEKTRPVDKVEIDLALSAHANARRWYELRKKQEMKQEKTVSAHEKAFKAAERKTRHQLAQEKTVAAITHIRKVHWFEKFNWFITSENYLVISGRDAQQNEMIVKRYMSKGDLYIHADLHGASSTVIKNHKHEHPVPPLSLNQAGCYTVCQSQAWDSKIVTSAWWVYPHQVSKTAPTGEYLTIGSFMIRGKKNFLPPHPLIMGFGLLFRLDESSLALHLNERRVKGEDEGIHDAQGDGDALNEPPESDSDDSEDQSQAPVTNVSGEVITDVVDRPHFKDTSSNPDKDDTHENLLGDGADTTAVYQGTVSEDAKEISEASISSQLEVLIDTALELGPSKTLGKNHESRALPSEEFHDPNERTSAVRVKPYISKAERRKLKTGQRNSAIDVGEKDEKKQNNVTNPPVERNAEVATSKITRGRQGKLKKIKEKYAEQDSEEREIRMALLASAGKVNKNEKQHTVSDPMKSSPGPVESIKICYKCKKTGHLSKDCPEHTVEAHRLKDELDRITIEEEGIHEIGEEEKGKLNEIDYLTGNPLPNDILLYAIPVCGPYNALQTYKYRVKITPGNAKKGKAAKTAMNLFSHMSEAATREKELMKACTDSELVAAIVGNARITAPGLTQLKQKQRKGKKSQKGT